jgi:hypothetical protein
LNWLVPTMSVGDEIEFVQVRHEELASFAACGHAKLRAAAARPRRAAHGPGRDARGRNRPPLLLGDG